MEPFTLVIIGITSNLAQIKLIPTLYDLVKDDQIGSNFSVIGVGRTSFDETGFHSFIQKVLRTKNRHHSNIIDENIEKKLLSRISYLSADLTNPENYHALKNMIKSSPSSKNRLFYLATFPSLYSSIFSELKAVGLTGQKNGWTRVMIEKPIGSDQSSAQELNSLLAKYFVEDQVFRLDHYLGKETLHDILKFRFERSQLESQITKDNVDHIQVTAAEDYSIGQRGSYYDVSGAIKDVGQNHLLQMIALATMEKPNEFTNELVTQARVNVLKGLTPDQDSLILGQYEGYHDEPNVGKDSMTETYFAFKTTLDNDRFAGVPIYVRAGKYLPVITTQIKIIFKNKSVLTYLIGPHEGITLVTADGKMSEYSQARTEEVPDAYEKLIIDALRGDQTYFNDAIEIDAQWAFTDVLLAQKHGMQPIIYPRGSWGPKEADELLARDGRKWL